LAQERPNLNTSPFTIGRSGNNLDMPFCRDPARPRFITFRDGRFVLRDEDSTNGTTVNGKPVNAKVDIALEPGFTIGLGQGTTLRFELL
jgi:hypothetical protein